MKIELTEVSPVKRTMTVQLDAQEVARETEAVVRTWARKARLPGFRPGKVPLDVVRKRFAKEVREDVRERVVSRYYHEAAREKELRPVGDPVLEELTDDDGDGLAFKTSFEVLPSLDVVGYRGVEVRRPPAAVDETDVERALEEIRQSRVRLVTEEGRPAATGDVAVVDVRAEPGGGEPFEREGMMIEIGAGDNLPAFNDGLQGARAGEDREFSVEYPEDYAGREVAGRSVRYAVRIKDVKRKELPELDDELAKDLGDFDDLAALRARVRQDLEARRAREADNAVRQQVMDKVLMQNPTVLPETLVEGELRHRLEEIVRRMMMQGVDPQKAELDWKKLRDQQQEPARKSVHARLMLDAVARAESLEVSAQEVEQRLRDDARAMGESVEQLRARLKEHGGVEALKVQILREKSLDLLTSVANIQNEE